jgi:hypothetical protein
MDLSLVHSIILKDIFIALPDGDKLSPTHHSNICDIFESGLFCNNDVFSEQGSKCYRWGFLVSGMMKSSSMMPNNKTRFRDFNYPGYNIVVGDFDSITSREVSKQTIYSMNDSFLIYTYEAVFNNLCLSTPYLSGIGKNISQFAHRAKKQYLQDCEGMTNFQKETKFENDYSSIGKKINIGERAYYFDMSRNKK